MPLKFHFSGITLGINLASCSQLFCPISVKFQPVSNSQQISWLFQHVQRKFKCWVRSCGWIWLYLQGRKSVLMCWDKGVGSGEISSPMAVGVGHRTCCGSLRRVKCVEAKIMLLQEENDLTLSCGGVPPLGRGVAEQEG